MTTFDDTMVEALKAVAHPLRLRILQALSGAERNVGEIDAATGIGQPALSQQLGVLRKAELVETRKEAKLVYYKLATDRLGAVAAALSTLADRQQPTSPARPSAARPSASSGAANFARLTPTTLEQ